MTKLIILFEIQTCTHQKNMQRDH